MIALLGDGIALATIATKAVGDTLIYRQHNANLASQLCGMYNVNEGEWYVDEDKSPQSGNNSMLLNLIDERYNRNLVPDALALSYDIYRVGAKTGQAFHTKSFNSKSEENSDSKGGWVWLNDYIKHPDGYPSVSQEMRAFFKNITGLNYVDNGLFGSGLVSGVFFQLIKNGKIRVAYVTKGTSLLNLKDWIANGSQGWDGNSGLYKAAYEIAKKINAAKTSVVSCLYFFGHSLGGGMANYNAMTTGNPSVTFNAASVHPNSVIENLDKYQFLVKNKSMIGIYVKGEALSTELSNIVGLPKNGNRYEFEIESDRDNAIQRHLLEPMCAKYHLSDFKWNERKEQI